MDLNSFKPNENIIDGCLQISDNLSIEVDCAKYNNSQFGFKLDFYPNPEDPSGVYFELDVKKE